MQLRPAAPSDLDAVVRVKVEAIRPNYEPRGSEALAEDFDVQQQESWLSDLLRAADDARPFIVASDDAGEIRGWMRLGPGSDIDEAEIKGLFVDPTCQGSGVGRLLVREGARAMTARGYRRLRVQTLTGSPACTFYEHIGGTYSGDVPFRARFKESAYEWDDLGSAGDPKL